MTFVGPVDNAIPQHVADHILAVVREALTNAAKHARATHYSVALSVDEQILLEVVDNGVGINAERPASGGLGLTNLRSRADKLGGSFEIHDAEGGGTQLVWSIPL